MADTVVSVTIRAQVAEYLRGMNQVAQATQQANTAAQNLQARGEGFEKVGKGLLTIGAAAAAGVALAVKSFADFDAQMSQVQSLSHATATEMDTLRNAALTMGQGIGFSATEVAQAETELVKAGVSVKDIMGGALKGALNLAAAGQIDVARATEIASAALTQFGLSGKDVPHVADLLAAAADKSLGGVEELGQALQQSGLVANQFGLTIDDTVGTLAEFAANGLLGSDAGTSFKSMLLQLATPSKQAAQAMEQYNIQAYDAQGNFVGITGLSGQLAEGFKGVDSASRDAALGIIFGSDAIRAANILYKDGASGNAEWIKSVNEAGFAAQQAAGKTDNLNGDVKKLGAALESGLIKTGSASNGVLREMVQSITGLAQAYSNAPAPIQATVLALGATVAATALAGGGFLTMVPKIAAARLAMQQMNLTAGKIARGFGVGSVALLGVVALTSAFANLGSEAQLTDGQISKLNGSLAGGGIKALNAQFVGGSAVGFDAISSSVTTARGALKALDDDATNINFAKFTDGLTFGLLKTSDTAKRFEAQFKQMGTVLATTAESDVSGAAEGFNSLVKQMGGGQETAKKLLDRMGPYKDELTALAAEAGKTASEQDLLNLAQGKGELAATLAAASAQGQKEQLAELSGVASEADQSISDLADSIRNFGSTQLDVEQTESDFQAAIDAAADALKENGKSLDLNTEKGRDNASALRQIAQDGIAATAAIAENGGTQEEAAAKMQTTRDAYIAAAQQFGLTKDQAAAMADQLKLIPANVETLFSEQGADTVQAQADEVKRKADAATQKKILKVQGDVKDAQEKLEATKQKLASVPASKKTTVKAEVTQANNELLAVLRTLNQLQSKTLTVTTVNRKVDQAVSAGADRGAAGAAYRASGGYISGPGTATSDSIPAMLSNGEYVIQASSVARYGTPFLDRVNAGRYADGGLVQRFAKGGKPKPVYTYNAGGNFQFTYNRRAGQYDGLSGVSELMSMFGNASLPNRLREQSVVAALKYQASLGRLTDQSTAAASKLSDLRSSADSLKTSVASAVGKFDVGNYRSASSLQRGLSKTAGNVKEFANLLTTLSKKGISGALLSEIASLGTAEGLPLARSLANASAADIKSINASYASIQSTATKAGQTVADANYKSLIASADKNAKSLEAQIAKQSRAIQNIIAKGFGLRGYSVGGYTGDYAADQVAGVVHGREFVMNAAATARNRSMLEAMNQGRDVRYMDASPVAARTQPAQVVQRAGNHYNITVQDPTAVAQAIERRERSEYV